MNCGVSKPVKGIFWKAIEITKGMVELAKFIIASEKFIRPSLCVA